jgi:hypothetical protein
MKTPTQIINIESASVKVMRSHDYCHFEVCLSSSSATTPQGVDELRKAAARLADKAVEQYKIAKVATQRLEYIQQEYLHNQAMGVPEGERTPEQQAIIKFKSDAAFAARFNYDYEEEWEQP